MSAEREWEPGDVAMVTASNRREPYRAYYDGRDLTWRACDNTSFCVDRPTSIRPLVVIDPENREQVERLRNLLPADWGLTADMVTRRETFELVQAALREFTNPASPVPEEPTGLGAVVEDIEGIRWTRVESGEARTRNPWYPADSDFQPDEWHNLCAIRVLSEGVTE